MSRCSFEPLSQYWQKAPTYGLSTAADESEILALKQFVDSMQKQGFMVENLKLTRTSPALRRDDDDDQHDNDEDDDETEDNDESDDDDGDSDDEDDDGDSDDEDDDGDSDDEDDEDDDDDEDNEDQNEKLHGPIDLMEVLREMSNTLQEQETLSSDESAEESEEEDDARPTCSTHSSVLKLPRFNPV